MGAEMRIALYDCVAGDALTEKYGPTGDHVVRWIAPHLPEAEFVSVHVAVDVTPPAPGTVDGIIISGSEKGVYDETSWMQPLRENLLAHRDHGTAIFGICFGHQLMADVFGGKAEKAGHPFAAGARPFEIGGAQVLAYVAHQDQVTQVPPSARVTAAAPYCPAAGLAYDFPALSVQFHPEYDAQFAEDLLDMFGHELMEPDQIAEARATIDGQVSRDLYTAEAVAFFRAHAGRA